jgi:hypothetical protein
LKPDYSRRDPSSMATGPSVPEPESKPAPSAAESDDAASKPAAPLGQVITAVVWSFFGVRRNQAMRDDLARIRPHQVIIVGVILAAVFVLTLIAVVRLILANATG